MATGVRFRNGDSVTTIDSNFSNFTVYQKGVTQAPGPNAQGWGLIKLNVPEGMLAAVRTGGRVCLAYSDQYPTNGVRGIYYYVTANANMEWWIFGRTSQGIIDTSTNIGVRIRNQDTGEVMFDSRSKPMKVIDFIYANDWPVMQGVDPPVHSYNIAPAIVFSDTAWSGSAAGIPGTNPPIIQYVYNQQGWNMMGAAIQMAFMNTYGATYDRNPPDFSSMIGDKKDYSTLVLDVTGL